MWGRLNSALLLHGMTGGPQEMWEMSQRLNQRGLITAVPRLSGHETSLYDLSQTTLQTWRSEVQRSLLQLNPPCLVIGLSFGALLALALAEEHASLVAGAVLLSPPFKLRAPMEQILALTSLAPESLLAVFGGRLGFLKKVSRPHALAVERHSYPAHSIAAILRLFKLRRLVLRDLHKLNSPTLLLQDPFDHHLSPDSYKVLSQRYPCKFRLLQNAQHELTLGHMRDQVFVEVEQFIAGIADAT